MGWRSDSLRSNWRHWGLSIWRWTLRGIDHFHYLVTQSNPPTAGLLTRPEDLSAAIATRGELGVVAVAAVDLVRFGAELLVHQRHATLAAQEARFVPVLVFVGKVLLGEEGGHS